jgi:hypothetical protein
MGVEKPRPYDAAQTTLQIGVQHARTRKGPMDHLQRLEWIQGRLQSWFFRRLFPD